MPSGRSPVFLYEVTYADGTNESIGIRKGPDTADWSDPANGENMRIAWRGLSLGNQDIGVSLFAWDNPHPDKPITGITARIAGNPAIVTVLGVTLSQSTAALPSNADMSSLPEWKRFVRLWPYSGRFEVDGWTPELLKRGSDQIRFLHGVQTRYFLSQERFFKKRLEFHAVFGTMLKFDPGVDVFCVLAEDHHIHILRAFDRGRHTLIPAHRAHAGIQVQQLAQGHIQRTDTPANRRGQRPKKPD